MSALRPALFIRMSELLHDVAVYHPGSQIALEWDEIKREVEQEVAKIRAEDEG